MGGSRSRPPRPPPHATSDHHSQSSPALSGTLPNYTDPKHATHPTQNPSLSADAAIEYVRNTPPLLDRLVRSTPDVATGNLDAVTENTVRIREVTDGLINEIYVVEGADGCSFLLKHAPPYIKSMGEEAQLSQERMRIEAKATQLERMRIEAKATQLVHSLNPDQIPELLWYDGASCIMAQQYLAGHVKLMYILNRGVE
eukprot:gene11913-15014_t